MSEFNEPWTIDADGIGDDWSWITIQGDGKTVASMDLSERRPQATAERIVACVNALAGIPTEELGKNFLQMFLRAKQYRMVVEGDPMPYFSAGDVVIVLSSCVFKPTQGEPQ